MSHPSSIHTNISLPSSFGEQAGRQCGWVGDGSSVVVVLRYVPGFIVDYLLLAITMRIEWQAGINARSNLFRLLVYRFDALPVLCHMKEASSITGSSSEIRNERMCTVVCSAVVGSIIRIYLRLWAN